jgi:DNA-directed RNA polymerase specialized sigma24 family protein
MHQVKDRSFERSLTVEEWIVSDRLQSIVFAVAHRLLIPEHDLRDVLQLVMMDLCRRGLATQLNVSYVTQVAKHRAVDIGRVQRRGDGVSVAVDNATGNPELQSLLRARVSSLAGPMRELYSLLYEEGLTEREAALRLKVSRGAIRRWEARMLIRLGVRPQRRNANET